MPTAFSPLTILAEQKLKAFLRHRNVNPDTIVSTTWCGDSVLLFTANSGHNPAHVIAVKDFT